MKSHPLSHQPVRASVRSLCAGGTTANTQTEPGASARRLMESLISRNALASGLLTNTVKAGMMQELLTGRGRLV